ncbi:MAG: substrate-binding domain-containing protein, partial [Firmicutes bacterium]|nr:substrate-binding domain-containing protein [Bacillota bacterium]
ETVTPENREKIQHALEVLNYKGNKVARILASGKTEFIGLIVPNMYLSFYGEVMDRFLKSHDRYGYKFIVFSGSGDEESERRYIGELLSYHVEGLIVLSHTIPSFELASYRVPVVVIEREDQYISSVNTDNRAGGALAARHLCEQGCDVLFHINKADDDPRVPAQSRIEGFCSVCEELQVPHQVLTYEGETSYSDLEEKIVPIIEGILDRWPDQRKGLFCSSDSIANIALNCLLRRFGKLPEDFRIIGFDGSPIASQSVLPLSTVEQQIDLLVDNAMELLIERIQAKKDADSGRPVSPRPEPKHRVIPPVLRPGATT